MKNPFPLKAGQIRCRIDNVKLTIVYLHQKIISIALTHHAKPIVNKFLKRSVVG